MPYNFRKRKPYLSYAVSAAKRVAPFVRAGMKAYRSYSRSKTRTKNRTFESGILTNQYDVKRQYRRRRVSRRRLRRTRKFSSRVRSVIASQLADNYIVEQSSESVVSLAGLQTYSQAVIYGCKSGAASTTLAFGQNDLNRVASAVEASPSTTEGRLQFKSAVLECQWTADAANTATAIVDIYHVIARKDMAQVANVNNLGDLFFYGVNDLLPLVVGSPISAATVGVSPFQSPIFCQNMMILKKDRVLLSPGQVCHRLMRDSKVRSILWDREETQLFNKKGWTQGYLWIANGAPSALSISPAVTINFSAIRTYNVKVDSFSLNSGTIN